MTLDDAKELTLADVGDDHGRLTAVERGIHVRSPVSTTSTTWHRG